MKRRAFIERAVLAGTAAIVTPQLRAATQAKWEIGCFNRPWTKWSFDQTLTEIKSGYFHIFLRSNSSTRASSGVIVAHLTPTPCSLIASAASIVT